MSTVNKIILIVLDSLGAGELPDSAVYNDKGADTLGHIIKAMGNNYYLDNLAKLGLYNISNTSFQNNQKNVIGCYGKMATKSPAKDTTAGHWELSGIVLNKPFPTYPNGFPDKLIKEFEKQIGIKVLGNCVASGTEIIQRLGAQHEQTGYPIIYTSADSVFQIACSEETFGLEKLYDICRIARNLLQGEHAVGRVIARPFVKKDGAYVRTTNRHDFSLTPTDTTVLDLIYNSDKQVISVGKIYDIFAGKSISKSYKTKSNVEGIEKTIKLIKQPAQKNTFIFTNLVDFDMLWGHRRNILAYAQGIKYFNDKLPEIINALNENDVLMITADHGCDPSYTKHTDHTREYVPLLIYGKQLKNNVDLGVRNTLSDVGQTIADIFNLPKLKNGTSFKTAIF
jgi:phosphopentomutase